MDFAWGVMARDETTALTFNRGFYMAETTVTSSAPAPRKRRGWLRAIAWILGVLVVLLVVAWFVVTSSAFFKGVILPRVSAALNATVTASDASISPFSQVVLRNLKVQTTGTEPLVNAPEVRLRYSLMDILRGNLHVDEVALVSPTIALVTNPDGTSNLDPILKAQETKPPEKKPAPAQPSKPAKIDLKKFAITDATLRKVKLYKGTNSDVSEISHLTMTLDDVKNGGSGKFAIAADLKVDNNPPAPADSGHLQAKLNGSYTFALSPDLKPASAQGNTRLEVTRAEGSLAQAAAFGANFDCDLTSTEIKQIALRFQKGATPLGEVRVNGPLDMEKSEGHLTVQLLNVDKNLLNLAGAANGLDFGPTRISSSNDVQIAKSGKSVSLTGQFSLNQFQVTRTNQTTPPMDLRADYSLAVDQAASNAVISRFTVTSIQKGNQIIQGELANPMTIAWGNPANAVGDSTLNVAVNHLNLADWQAFLGTVAPAGDVNGKLQLVSQQAGKQLTLDLSSEIDNLTAGSGSNQITQATVSFQLNGKASDLKQITLNNCALRLTRQNQTLVNLGGTGAVDTASQNTDLQFTGQAMLAPLLQAFPQPGNTVSAGTAQFTAHLPQKVQSPATNPVSNVTGTFALAGLTGQFGSNSVRNLGLNADLDLGMNGQQAQIRKISGKLTAGSDTAGSLDVTGNYDNASGGADMQITGQILLARLLSALVLPDAAVTSGTADLKAHVTQQAQPPGTTNLIQNVSANFTLSDFTGRFASNVFNKFGTTADLDLTLTPQQAQVRKLSGKLTEGTNAGGSFDLSGNFNRTNYASQFTAKVADLNQNGLRPFLQSKLGDKQLVSVALNANATLQYDPKSASAEKADLQVTNLVVNDPSGQFPKSPLSAKMQLDVALNQKVADIKQCVFSLTPTARATNQVNLTGHIDWSNTNTTGNLKLAADSLDLTTYYDLFGGQKKAPTSQSTAATSATPASTNAPAAPEKEPDAISLPVRNFVADAAIRRLYLHEIEVADFQTTLKIDGGHIVIDPLKLALNSAPVNSTVDLDMGVTGFKYGLTFGAQAVPLAPLVNSFQPERKGILSGTMTALGKVNGAGITGTNLQKNLAGQFDIGSTNLNLSIDNIPNDSVATRVLKVIVSAVTSIPEIVKNPTGSALSLGQNLFSPGTPSTSSTPSSGGSTNEISKSPINSIILRGTMGSGRVDLQQAQVQSPAFETQMTGTVSLASVLTNSPLQMPVAVYLERSVAQKLHLAGNTPTNAAYARMPDFLALTGTVGNPKTHIDYLALATTAMQGVGGAVGQAGSILQGLRGGTNTNSGTNQPGLGGLLQGVLGGGSAGSTNASGTNKPAGGLGNMLEGILGSGARTTNSVSTNRPPTNQPPPGGLLDRFLNPK